MAVTGATSLALRAGEAGCVFENQGMASVLCDSEVRMAPPLHLTQWMNTPEGKPLALKSLQGKVVVIAFWGVW